MPCKQSAWGWGEHQGLIGWGSIIWISWVMVLIELQQLRLAGDMVQRKFNLEDEVNKRAIL